MHRSLFAIALGLGFALVAAPEPVHAFANERIQTNIPFKFSVDGTTMPAGKYYIERVSSTDSSVLKIEKADGSKSVMFLTKNGDRDNSGESPRVVFRRRGRPRALHAVLTPDSSTWSEVVQAPPAAKMARTTTTRKQAATNGNSKNGKKAAAGGQKKTSK
jgi:hypothetical protein